MGRRRRSTRDPISGLRIERGSVIDVLKRSTDAPTLREYNNESKYTEPKPDYRQDRRPQYTSDSFLGFPIEKGSVMDMLNKAGNRKYARS